MPQVVFLLRIGPAVAFFLALAALDHLLVAAPSVHRWYEHGLARRANYARWIEYSISASVMIVLIGLFVGIRDLAAVVAIFAANTAMILFGLLMERQQRPGAADWSAFWFGSLVGVVPWVLIAVYVAQPAQVPGFVYAITIVQFVLFSASRSTWRCSTRRSGAGATTSTAEVVVHRPGASPPNHCWPGLFRHVAHIGAVGCDPAQRSGRSNGWLHGPGMGATPRFSRAGRQAGLLASQSRSHTGPAGPADRAQKPPPAGQ